MVAVCVVFAILLGVLACVDQRALWWSLSAWQFRNPEANEPSDAANALGRIMAVVGAIGFAVAAIAMSVDRSSPYDQGRLDALGRSASVEFSGSYYKYGSPGAYSIGEFLEGEAGSRVTVSEAGSETTSSGGFKSDSHYTDRFELRSADDASVKGCLIAEYDSGLFHDGPIDVGARYESGAC